MMQLAAMGPACVKTLQQLHPRDRLHILRETLLTGLRADSILFVSTAINSKSA